MDANDLPLAYNTPRMKKAVVIMTDGANTMSAPIRTAYGFLGEGKLGSTEHVQGRCSPEYQARNGVRRNG